MEGFTEDLTSHTSGKFFFERFRLDKKCIDPTTFTTPALSAGVSL
jgi:hypothetical protein